MQVFVYKDAQEVARAAAMVYAAQLFQKPASTFGLATGSTPVLLYRELIALNKEGLIDFSQASSYNLDEYVGLAPDHPCSYRRFMNEQLFDHINIDKANTHVPCGLGDVQQNAADYDRALDRTGGIDLQLLGIGHNGHIGFNEPNERAFVYPTNIVTLTQSTLEANARFFARPEDVPKQAISTGMGGIMAAKRVILLATGKGKAAAVRDSIKGEVTPMMPASILQMHQNAQFFLDEDAASLL